MRGSGDAFVVGFVVFGSSLLLLLLLLLCGGICFVGIGAETTSLSCLGFLSLSLILSLVLYSFVSLFSY